MAAFELFLSHARRHCSSFPPYHFSSLIRRSSSHLQLSSPQDLKLSTSLSSSTSRSSFLGFHRFLSSSPENPDPIIKPVSYTPKPKSEESTNTEEEFQRPPRELRGTRPPPPPEQASNADAQPLTLEDIRYLKDASPAAYSARVDRFSGGPPSISPVSYPTRAAPLPEDKNEKSEELGEDRQRTEFEMERRRMPTELRSPIMFRKEEEKVLPFPTLIKKEKNKPKVVLDLQEAIKEVKANAKAGFDETVEAHVNMGVDPRRGDQMVRGATTLPHGTGKTIRIAVFAEGSAAEEARAAGADIIGGDELIEEIRKGGGKLNFDKCIATPVFMPRLGKIARILGPRGLMPNPKLGSVTSDVSGAVRDAKRGRIDFKIDKTAIIHVGLGKVSFTEASLRENVGAFVNALLLAKPVGLKKTSKYAGYVNSFSLCSTMGPGFPVSIQSLSLAADHYNKLQLK